MLNHREEHIKMWDWLAKNPYRGKYAYFCEVLTREERGPSRACFACQYVQDIEESNSCGKCPINWASNSKDTSLCMAAGSIYHHYLNAETLESKIKYAELIRDAWPEEIGEEKK